MISSPAGPSPEPNFVPNPNWTNAQSIAHMTAHDTVHSITNPPIRTSIMPTEPPTMMETLRASSLIITGKKIRFHAAPPAVEPKSIASERRYSLALLLPALSVRLGFVHFRDVEDPLERAVEDAGEDVMTIAGTEVTLYHLVVTPEGGEARHVWVDALGRVIRVEIPDRNYVAVRTAVPS